MKTVIQPIAISNTGSLTLYAIKGDTTTISRSTPEYLVALTPSEDGRHILAITDVSGKSIRRKLSVTRDKEYAAKIFAKCRKMVGQRVTLGVTQGWDGDVWFNDIQVDTKEKS